MEQMGRQRRQRTRVGVGPRGDGGVARQRRRFAATPGPDGPRLDQPMGVSPRGGGWFAATTPPVDRDPGA